MSVGAVDGALERDLEAPRSRIAPRGGDRLSSERRDESGDAYRAQLIWHGWLQQLASDPEAALAAALAYRELDACGRTQWLNALDSDSVDSGVSKVAVYAPLLAVEQDPQRRLRIGTALQSGSLEPDHEATAVSVLRARDPRDKSGRCFAVLTRPLYLDFVQTLACCYVPGRSFEWVKHDPIAKRSQAPIAGSRVEGLALEAVPRESLLDELAETVLAHSRAGGELPEALCLFADLFGPTPAPFSQSERFGEADEWQAGK